MKGRILVAGWILLLAPALWAGESVLYSVTEQSVVYAASNRPVGLSIAEDRTDVFAVDPETGKPRLVFSDANAEIMLMPGGRTPRGIVAAGGRIFSVAVDRGAWANDPRSMKAVYELSTDGSGRTRKIFDIDNFSNLFVSPSGSKIGYTPGDSTETNVLIRDTATGKLLRNAEIFSRTSDGEGVVDIGWMPDGERIFFSLGVAGDDDQAFWNTPNSPVGTYLMKDDDAVPARLATEAELHFETPGKEPDISEAAAFIGVLPDGRYLFSDCSGESQYGHARTELYGLDLAKKMQRIFPLQVGGYPYSFHLSRFGGRLALMARHEKDGESLHSSAAPTSVVDVWVLELESGRQSKPLSFAIPGNTHGFKGPWINLIGSLAEQ